MVRVAKVASDGWRVHGFCLATALEYQMAAAAAAAFGSSKPSDDWTV